MHTPDPSDAFEFGLWSTPFENADIDILEVGYGAAGLSSAHRQQSIFKTPIGGDLLIRLQVRPDSTIYRLQIEVVSAFRLLDEHGLLELWRMTGELGRRPAKTTFRIRNHLWSRESPISFLCSDGWSFVVATDDACVEIVAAKAPTIVLEK